MLESRGQFFHLLAAGSLLVGAVLVAGCTSIDADGFGSATAKSGVTNEPAPGFKTVKAGSEEDFILNVGRRTYFDASSSALSATAKRTLDKQADWLQRYPKWYLKLQGHADDPGGSFADRKLSQERADAVMAYLVSRGVDPDRMWAKGYARERLVRNCPELECKAQNRRVVSNLRKSKEDDADA
jgi:peptidoglycan-associated lipoprotein